MADSGASRSKRTEQPSTGGGIFVIHNPMAGVRHPDRLRRRVESELESRGIRFEYAFTEDRGHGEELTRRALERGFDRVLVAGGDGTVLEAAVALIGTESALAMLPVGTGNQLAANLGLPRGLKKLLNVAVTGVQRKIDVGMLDGRPFTIIAGAGFDAEVIRPPASLKRRIGYLAYVQAATGAAIAPKVSRLRVVVDGKAETLSGIGVEVANMPGLTAPTLVRPVDLVPNGKPDDGLLDVCVLAVESTVEFVAALTAIMTGRQKKSSGLQYFRGREVRVEADPPLPVQIDGELLDKTTPFVATVRPLALNVIVPDDREGEAPGDA
ncbi:MAG: diacylglycerol kinase family lipid kinase [Gemmatimonadetes bacterium]|uniref:Diacylglycerol kinase family lipid kinase n=1 Tax=Candidatus Kutchimonas denitrificans TaxID=3056748 RepID=A0AAE4ZCV1_9BACT|nr:diacylglycerol kinase family lipid kinase [Gemmatimonadota bacterium]NIR75535.1 diacylglycerol kinase family lipid kinase [Candidatus Kutchimonas denitrificans]NIS01849.1 diacylglycerol kinase family lipid kinase [Gemmatimonadota bacterium]NIT67630.1 diacylglycerol kinase family lipid kinase [Gemmatimonadota bacterium]NIU53504.1 YegS/Rv2252/BmrU family lipid kinase [Gemmatimonadota bacterium]